MGRSTQSGQHSLTQRRLTDEQLDQLLAELAEQSDFSGAVWLRPRVNDMVKNRTAQAAVWVVRHRGSVTTLLLK